MVCCLRGTSRRFQHFPLFFTEFFHSLDDNSKQILNEKKIPLPPISLVTNAVLQINNNEKYKLKKVLRKLYSKITNGRSNALLTVWFRIMITTKALKVFGNKSAKYKMKAYRFRGQLEL